MNDSSTGGFLLPLIPPPIPLEDDQLDDLLQAWVVGLTGLPSEMVRPRWQTPTPTRPQSTTDWAAIGITDEQPEYGFVTWHHGSQKAFGWFDFTNTNPSPGDTISINGYQFTFTNIAPTDDSQVAIGSSLGMTLFNLLVNIDPQTDARLTVMDYQVLGSRFMCTATVSGTAGNVYTLAASAATVSADTLFGGDSDGFDEYQRHEDVTVLATFYGPHSRGNAKTFRDGMSIPQNREILQLNYMNLASTNCKVRHIPELYNQTWFRRSDIEFCLRVAIDRCYAVKNLLSAPIQLFTDIGLITQGMAGPAQPVRQNDYPPVPAPLPFPRG